MSAPESVKSGAEVHPAVPGCADADAAVPGKLRWRCRRGMRELDELLTRYVDKQYAVAPESQRAAFRQLLDSPDPLIYDYFLGRQAPADPVLSSLIGRITTVVGDD